ncbi:MAG: pyruvate, phosphate dikinase [Eubacteriaceae bacterium]|nr:pyruvate, phosphate dikinase [Eubacteriaceae bacterium]
MAKKYVYSFEEADGLGKDLLGGKGAGLAEMTGIGLPVPPGFTVTTEACTLYYESGQSISEDLKEQIFAALLELEEKTGKEFGGGDNPLLVSVRSGAKFSMPGMMDTILNLGLNPTSVAAIASKTNNPRFAYDSYRRFIMMFSDIAIGLDKELFDRELDERKQLKGVEDDIDLDAEDMIFLSEKYTQIYLAETGEQFPDDPNEQLMVAVNAIFGSWNNQRAISYRRLNNISNDLGTAVNIQSMVYGNMGSTSGTGVAFTRNPATGEKEVFGEYLINAQGEDVVAGIRTPYPIERLSQDLPDIYSQFLNCANILENKYKDVQDIEFTIEDGKLFFLQTRTGKRTAQAALKIAVDLVNEGIIDSDEAVMRVDAASLDQLLYPQFAPEALSVTAPAATGLPASPGAVSGKAYFSAEDAVIHAQAGEDVILVRRETSPEDIEGMHAAKGFLTARGGMTSHAAVVARGMGKTCIAGCVDVVVNETEKFFTVGGTVVREGDEISLNGTTGNLYIGKLPTVPASMTGDFGIIMKWADEKRRMKIRANADTPEDAKAAIGFGAEGIGLCRTEHMFFDSERIYQFRKMICSETLEQREQALAMILPMQREDFIGIFKEMNGLPVTIRLLDPPLHEFLPHSDEDIKAIASELDMPIDKLHAIIDGLAEFNPMLGHRGCRLTVTYPEIGIMQTRAIIEAAVESQKAGIPASVEIMIPLPGSSIEYEYCAKIIRETADEILRLENIDIDYMVGTMIEIPRAALTSYDIAQTAEFFSFGTNDLTQMAMGFSRDDAGKFIRDYLDKKILEADPFQTIDQAGVGLLVQKSVEDGRRARPNLKIGVCGEHGGDPASIEFFHECGLDYVSCSPFRVPIARLSAAQATVQSERQLSMSHKNQL